jgi:CheY-like chemotaxis protein
VNLPDHAVILLAEDLSNDVFLVRRALANAGVKNPFFVVSDGEECLAYLRGVGKFSNRDEYPLPDILLLDLKMPRMDGFEVLREIRANKAFAPLRVIVLTSSEEISDVNKAYELGANSFLVKPLEFDNYTAMMRTLSAFWLKGSRAPVIERPPKRKDGSEKDGAGNGKNGHPTSAEK